MKRNSNSEAGKQRKSKQKLELVSHWFSSGDLLFNDDDPLSKAVVQKKNLTCKSQIERRTTTIKKEEYGLTDIFLLEQNEMKQHCLTGGYKCFPICIEYHNEKKIVVKNGTAKNAIKARAEKDGLTIRNI
eukprot:15365201-Ditylum_brightwellii.AAC.2